MGQVEAWAEVLEPRDDGTVFRVERSLADWKYGDETLKGVRRSVGPGRTVVRLVEENPHLERLRRDVEQAAAMVAKYGNQMDTLLERSIVDLQKAVRALEREREKART